MTAIAIKDAKVKLIATIASISDDVVVVTATTITAAPVTSDGEFVDKSPAVSPHQSYRVVDPKMDNHNPPSNAISQSDLLGAIRIVLDITTPATTVPKVLSPRSGEVSEIIAHDNAALETLVEKSQP